MLPQDVCQISSPEGVYTLGSEDPVGAVNCTSVGVVEPAWSSHPGSGWAASLSRWGQQWSWTHRQLSIYLSRMIQQKCSRPATRSCTFVINPSLFLTLKIFLLLKWQFFIVLWKTTHNLSIYLYIYSSIHQSIHLSIYLALLTATDHNITSANTLPTSTYLRHLLIKQFVNFYFFIKFIFYHLAWSVYFWRLKYVFLNVFR